MSMASWRITSRLNHAHITGPQALRQPSNLRRSGSLSMRKTKDCCALNPVRNLPHSDKDYVGESGRRYQVLGLLQDRGVPGSCVYKAT
jgi:hypothetical protein